MNKIVWILGLALLAAGCSQPPSPAERAGELVARLTLEQKAQLMVHPSAPVEQLGIPAYNWWNEALHGVARNGKATVFPQPIGMAASFDDRLLLEVFTAVSDEGRVKNRQALEAGHVGEYQGLTYWTPNINIVRDPRWGRGMETYGEDPYLTGRMGMAVVRGLQGPPDAPILKAHACAKHFAVHSGPESTRHQFDAEVSERDLRETYLPAFRDLVTKAGVQEVMTAYNRFRGIPCSANDYLVNTILRGEWGFEGIVVSDCWALTDFYEPGRHGYASDAAHSAALAVHTGVDMNCGTSYRHIPEAVELGLLSEAEVDRSLERLLSARIRLGELDGNIQPWEHLGDDIVEGEEHLALSRKMARESIVLLQNRDGILPLKPSDRIALIGPNADDREMLWGNYNPVPEKTVTLLDAFRERIPSLLYFRACGLAGAEYAGALDEETAKILLPALDVKKVLERLEGIGTVVFAGGLSPRLEGEQLQMELPGFKGGDRESLELPEVQRTLLKALHEAGKKVVLVNFSGSAVGLVPECVSCDAIVQAWYPGEEGGVALADVLFGDVVPSGKLPLTFYKDVSQLPDFSDYAMKGRTYRYFEGEPLFPFGFGLSYTSFSYGTARVSGRSLEIPVTNTGALDGAEVVQLYVRNPSDPEGPSKTLRNFRRVEIPAGKTLVVRFPLTEDTFLSWDEGKKDMVPVKGEWQLMYGGSSESLQLLDYRYK